MISNIQVFDILNELEETANKLGCWNIAKRVIRDEKFAICSGSSKEGKHHYGQNGLVVHTHQVVDLCLKNNELLGFPANEKLLFLAALFHDVGKCYDYEQDERGIWVCSFHKFLIHHITRSVLVFYEAAKDKLWEHDVDLVIHAILSHHGEFKECGSPVPPQKPISWILHLCDSISARVSECK